MSKAIFFAALLAAAEARFNQEGIPGPAVQALNSRGQPGQAGTLSGEVPGVLLAAAPACAKLQLADKIVQQLGKTDDVIAAARAVAGAEQNFNPFAVKIPKLCDDPTLPATEELRGVIPLVDPSVGGAATQNANAEKSRTTPLNANGLSVAGISIAQGFTNFTLGDTGKLASGGAGAGAGAGAAAGNTGNGNASAGNGTANAGNGNANNGKKGNKGGKKSCNGNAGKANANKGNKGNNNNNNNNNNNAGNNNNNAGNNNNNAGNNNAGALNFGTCKPTINFQLGRQGRKADEGTFQVDDPAILKGQQDALNPSIIMNRVCDQLNSRTCNANQAAIDKCLSAKKEVEAQVAASGTKDASTAALFNKLVQ